MTDNAKLVVTKPTFYAEDSNRKSTEGALKNDLQKQHKMFA